MTPMPTATAASPTRPAMSRSRRAMRSEMTPATGESTMTTMAWTAPMRPITARESVRLTSSHCAPSSTSPWPRKKSALLTQ